MSIDQYHYKVSKRTSISDCIVDYDDVYDTQMSS